MSDIQNVLLVDDDIDDYFFFEEAIKAVDSSIFLFHLSSMKEIGKIDCTMPDLVFLDINMPDKDGFEWLSLIREKEARIPVIMYSTASNANYVEKAYTRGANLYFPKPDSLQLLKVALRKLLSLDWATPQKITNEFCTNGKYKIFDATYYKVK
ncbi:response regulator [Flavisolibacter nicotianae]|uniref:response regulator n=1 Tax=Flavisolibacter nicotianae TaxID=2364882 RepID=UPI000EAE0D2F|nr:response regulator [Flavisolibacter nicotianae]